jgi:PTS system beta-glucosides-specific IIC component
LENREILINYLAAFFIFLSTNASWASAVLIDTVLPIRVMFGLHTAVGPGCVCSNIAQATATLVVSLRTKDAKTKQIVTIAGII